MEPILFKGLYARLTTLKREIDKDPVSWEYRKRAANPYECVFSSPGQYGDHVRWRGERRFSGDAEVEGGWRLVGSGGHTNTRTHGCFRPYHRISDPPLRVSVSGIRPISRAFFKMTELGALVRNYDDTPARKLFSEPIRVLHLAESPGGFVQSWRWHRERDGIIDDAMGVTIEKQPGKDPWDRLKEVSHRWRLPPRLRVGDLFSREVRDSVVSEYSEGGASLVTGDGGFDFSADYCTQEEQATPLLLAELVTGLRCLREDGAMILKVFDLVTLPMIQVLWVFWKCFRSFQLVKPMTSRACNSERYIVARGFRGMGDSLRRFLNRCEAKIDSEERPIRTLFSDGPNASFDTMDPAFQAGVVGIEAHMRRQIITIQTALRIDPKEPEEMRSEREHLYTQNARHWCVKHGIPVSPDYLNAYVRS